MPGQPINETHGKANGKSAPQYIPRKMNNAESRWFLLPNWQLL